MKTSSWLIVLVAFLLIMSPQTARAEEGVPVFLDNLPLSFEVEPVEREGYTLAPFRAIAEALNVEVSWDAAAQTVTASKEDLRVRLQIGNRKAYRNETPISLEMAPIILNSKTFIPLRFFGEAFGCRVVWNETVKVVRLFSPPEQMHVIGFYALGDARTSSWRNLFGKDYPETDKGHTGALSELALGWYSLDKEGNLLTRSRDGWQRPDGWEKVLMAARDYNLGTEMVVHLTDYEGTIKSLLTNQNAVAKAIKSITEEASLYGGVNLNFEGLGWQEEGKTLLATKQAFSDFVRLLAERLKAENRHLTLTLHPANSTYQGYDYRALGDVADSIIIMAYEYGISPEPPDLVVQAIEMAREAVPGQKLVLGISIPSETPESLVGKIGLAKRYSFSGIALWRLGLVSDEMWSVLGAAVQPKK